MAHAGSTYAPRAESAGTSERVEPLKGWSRPHLASNTKDRRGREFAARIARVHGRGRSSAGLIGRRLVVLELQHCGHIGTDGLENCGHIGAARLQQAI